MKVELGSMLGAFRKRRPPVGAAPGTLVLSDSPIPPRIRVIQYDRDAASDEEVEDPSTLLARIVPGKVTWIDVQGLGDEAVLREIGAQFEIHPLALADVVNVPQRPKIDEYDHHVLFVSRMVQGRPNGMLDSEQFSIILGRDVVLTFQERYGDTLGPVRTRIRESKGMIRKMGCDYLAYALLDTVVDDSYPVTEQVSDWFEDVSDLVLNHPTPRTLARLNHLRSILSALRRNISPQRDALSLLLRDGCEMVSDPVLTYFRDTADHCSQLLDVIDGEREIANGLMNTYVSMLSIKTNEVMKVLTIMASIFIPLTFIAGVYGMNFERMPELHSPWGYPAALVAMGATAAGMLFYFFRKGWLGSGDRSDDEDERPEAGSSPSEKP